MPDWERLVHLNGGNKIFYVEPMLDAPTEVWFYSAGPELRIWRGGALVPDDQDAAGDATPVGTRHTLYHLRRQLVVDVEIRGDRAVVRRGLLNGALLTSRATPDELTALLAGYRDLGFRDGTPWHATATRVTVREYRRADESWTVTVDGTHTLDFASGDAPAADRDAAIADAESRIRAREADGWRPHLIELRPAQRDNPVPVPPAGVVVPAQPPVAPVVPPPATAYEAVDAAIAILTDLHRRIPTAHFLVELLDLPADRDRVEQVAPHPDFLLEMHADRVGRWRATAPDAPGDGESSWQYFARRYGSITWILDSEADAELAMFYCGNVSGGGWSCLEIDSEGTYDIDEHAEAVGSPELASLLVIHGGWHHGLAYALDRRVRSASGEHPVVDFGDDLDELPPPASPDEVEPFGTWLYRRVSVLAAQVERNVRELL